MKQGKIVLAKGYELIVPEHSDNTQIMVAIGMLTQIWALGEIENGHLNQFKFKQMLCEYVDKIFKKVEEEYELIPIDKQRWDDD